MISSTSSRRPSRTPLLHPRAVAQSASRSAVRFRNGLPAIIAYAETLSDVVARTVAPVRLAGSRQPGCCSRLPARCSPGLVATELRLRVLRGVSPVAVGARVGAGAAPAVAVGVAAGFVLALLGVMALGPTPRSSPIPVRAALLAMSRGCLAGTVVVGGVAIHDSARSVDTRPRHHWVRWVPWELAVVALAIASYRRGSTVVAEFDSWCGGRGRRPSRLRRSRSSRSGRCSWCSPDRCVGSCADRTACGGARGAVAHRLPSPLRRRGCTVLAALAVGLVIGSVGDVDHAHRQRRARCCVRRRARSSAPTSSSA